MSEYPDEFDLRMDIAERTELALSTADKLTEAVESEDLVRAAALAGLFRAHRNVIRQKRRSLKSLVAG